MAVCAVLGAEAPSLRIETSDGGLRVTIVAELTEEAISSLPEGRMKSKVGQQVLSLRLIGDDGDVGPPILGQYRRERSKLSLTPRYQLVPGYRYRATLVVSASRTIARDYRAPPLPATEPAVVERVYPSGATLPANHLKFYVYFSKPMREGRAIFERIHLLDEQDQRVADPWRRTELWTSDARRLTLWIHPGRVKTGVNLREELGPVLKPDRRYKLLVERNVQDASGQPLAKDFEKRFSTAAADRTRPLPAKWNIIAPTAGTRQSLRLQLGEPLDHALLKRVIEVRNSKGREVSGQVTVGAEETSWSFTPDAPWARSKYRLSIDPILEDLGGNTPLRVFDTDLQDEELGAPQLRLSFHPR
jgi:hypothetical protein